MTLKADWRTVRTRIEAIPHPEKPHDAPGFAESVVDNREWMAVYRTAGGFCCMHGGM
jgi:hypothetical protein